MSGSFLRQARPMCLCSNCIVAVPPDEVATWECLGEYKGILNPGLSFLAVDACGCCVNTRSISMRLMQMRTVCETKTKDNVFVFVVVAVQMQVLSGQHVYDAVYRLTDPSGQVDSFVKDVIRGQVPTMTLDEVFAAKSELAEAVKARLKEKMTEFGYHILNALVTDLEPDASVKAAMNEIETNKRMRAAREERAEANKNVMIKAAEAEAESKHLQGQGIANQRDAIITGLRSSIGVGEKISPSRVSELLLLTQYFDTLKEMSHGRETTVFVPHGIAGLSGMANQLREGCLGVGEDQSTEAGTPGQQMMSAV